MQQMSDSECSTPRCFQHQVQNPAFVEDAIIEFCKFLCTILIRSSDFMFVDYSKEWMRKAENYSRVLQISSFSVLFSQSDNDPCAKYIWLATQIVDSLFSEVEKMVRTGVYNRSVVDIAIQLFEGSELVRYNYFQLKSLSDVEMLFKAVDEAGCSVKEDKHLKDSLLKYFSFPLLRQE